METMTSPPEVRTRADEAAGAPSGITRRRAVPAPEAVRPAAAPTGTSTGTTATERAATARTARARVTVATRRPARTVERRAATAPQAPFAVLVVGLLGGALVSLLLLNTVLAQQTFTLSEVQRENQRLDERKQALQEDIARENSPEVLHAKARRLGMRDAERPVYVDARTGRVVGGGRSGDAPGKTAPAAP
jgi:cell division protein FtsB